MNEAILTLVSLVTSVDDDPVFSEILESHGREELVTLIQASVGVILEWSDWIEFLTDEPTGSLIASLALNAS